MVRYALGALRQAAINPQSAIRNPQSHIPYLKSHI
jgi:hypothetical protein